MRKVSTDHLHSDYTAAMDIRSPAGNILLNKGVTITPAMGRRLRNWGIAVVFVEGEDDSEQDVKTEKVSATKIRSELYAVFHGTLDSPVMKAIFNAACEHKMHRSGAVL
jgi:hypothetical protein